MSEESNDQKKSKRRVMPRKEPDFNAWSEEDAADNDIGIFGPGDPSDLPADRILKRLKSLNLRTCGSGPEWQAICPAHADTNPSLSIKETSDGTVLLHCHAGCRTVDILRVLEMKESGLYPSRYAQQFSKRKPFGSISFCGGHASTAVQEPTREECAHWLHRLHEYQADWSDLEELASQLKLRARVLRALQVGYDDYREAWIFPEFNDRYEIVGLIRRHRNGEKRAITDSHRGLTLPTFENRRPSGPLYIAEGASDAAALHMAGVLAIGRSTSRSSSLERRWLTRYLDRFPKRIIIVIGDRDRSGAGAAGAKDLAQFLTCVLGRPVYWALPKKRFKDVREQVVAGRWSAGLDEYEVRT